MPKSAPILRHDFMEPDVTVFIIQ